MAPGKGKCLQQGLRVDHPTLRTIVEVNSETAENAFVALMDWMHGTASPERVGLVELYAAERTDMLQAWVGGGLARPHEIKQNEQPSPGQPTHLPMQGITCPKSSR